ncbi:MAG: serine hydrolase [Gemmatimonadota bacterium]
MSRLRRLSALLLATNLAASLNSCGGGDPKTPTGPTPPTTAVAAVTVTATTSTLTVGQSAPLVASAVTAGGQAVSAAPFTWQSEAPAVATVDATGKVTAEGSGTAVIAATSGTVRGTTTVVVQPGPAAPVANLNKIIDSVRLAWKLPAMGAAIVTLEDGLVAVGAAGTRRATGGNAVTTDDLWHLGSNTKAMTAMLAAVAVSENRIAWTTTIAEAFPEIANIRAAYQTVTLRELLSHQSGLPSMVGEEGLGSGTTGVAQRASMVPFVLQQPPSGSRGSYVYNNLGYVVAGAMLERAFGASFEAAMIARIFTPLGMTGANWGPQAAVGSTTQPLPHRRQSDGSWSVLEAYGLPPVFNVSGTMHMSLATWGRFVREVLRVEAGTSTVALAAVARETTSEVIAIGPGTSYGMGWVVATRPWANGKTLDHNGSDGGNFSLAVLAPVRNVAFLITTNGVDPSGTVQALGGVHARLVAFYNTGK